MGKKKGKNSHHLVGKNGKNGKKARSAGGNSSSSRTQDGEAIGTYGVVPSEYNIQAQIDKLTAPPLIGERRNAHTAQQPPSKKTQRSYHRDICEACGEGECLMYCDKCPVAYHAICDDPPLPPEDFEIIGLNWRCKKCRALFGVNPESEFQMAVEDTLIAQPSHSGAESNGSNGVGVVNKFFSSCISQAHVQNPAQFVLPKEMPAYVYPFPGTSRHLVKRVRQRTSVIDLEHGIVPRPVAFCFHCKLSCRSGPLIQCDKCDLYYHLDCLDPPLTTIPVTIWMCPLHVEPYLESTQLTSVALSERVKIWDNSSKPVKRDTVIVDFLRKASRKNPMFRRKRMYPIRTTAEVPTMLENIYQDLPNFPNGQSQGSLDALAEACDMERIKLKYKPEQEVGEELRVLKIRNRVRLEYIRDVCEKIERLKRNAELGRIWDDADVHDEDIDLLKSQTVDFLKNWPLKTTGGSTQPSSADQSGNAKEDKLTPAQNDQNIIESDSERSRRQRRVDNFGIVGSCSDWLRELMNEERDAGLRELNLIVDLVKRDGLAHANCEFSSIPPEVLSRLGNVSAEPQNIPLGTKTPVNDKSNTCTKMDTSEDKLNTGTHYFSYIPPNARNIRNPSVSASTSSENNNVTPLKSATVSNRPDETSTNRPPPPQFDCSFLLEPIESFQNISPPAGTLSSINSPKKTSPTKTIPSPLDVVKCLPKKDVHRLAAIYLRNARRKKEMKKSKQQEESKPKETIYKIGAGSQPIIRLYVDNIGVNVEIAKRSFWIGGDVSCDWILTDLIDCKRIDDKHAKMFYNPQTKCWEILNYSPNGISVNKTFFGFKDSLAHVVATTPASTERLVELQELHSKNMDDYIRRNGAHFAENDFNPCYCKPFSIQSMPNVYEGSARLYPGHKMQIGCAKITVKEFLFMIK